MRKRMKWSVLWRSAWMLTLCTGMGSVMMWSCSSNAYEGKIVAVELAGETVNFEGSRLVVVDPEDTDKEVKVLTTGFYSACAPALNHEGRYLSFQAREQENDPWQIWIMDLQKGSIQRVTDLPENCIHPAALPDGSLIFSRESSLKGQKVFDLWRCQMDGSGLTRVTYDPSVNQFSSVLKEGRVLYTSTVQYPESQSPLWMIMRPDGTKSEVYFDGSGEVFPISDGSESDEGYIYFTGNGGQLARVQHRRPLHTYEELSAQVAGQFSAVVAEGGSCLVSYRPEGGAFYGLYRFDPETRTAPSMLFQGDKHLTDPVPVAAMPERPRILPSAVNQDNPTGLLMSQDINHSREPARPGLSGDTVADRIRIYTPDQELGVVEVKADGSFYVKLDADTPFRIESLNSQGEIVRGPSDWLYLRPNERRACVGCHADPELAPKNFQPLAVKEDPIVLSAKMEEISQ